MTELNHRMIICGEEVVVMDHQPFQLMILRGSDRVLLGIMYQVWENEISF
jgi:hypothetical protein